MRNFPYRLVGLASKIGQVIPIDEWAEQAQIPHRSRPGDHLRGEEITKILGVKSKSWDPGLFKTFETVRATAMAALKSAGVPPLRVDMAITLTCTPYEIMMDQDAFRLLRALELSDDVVPLQLSAGCGGLARAATLAAQSTAQRILIVAYNVPSLFLMVDGKASPAYVGNETHPRGELLWTSPAIFSDGAAALVLERSDDRPGLCFYSRDARAMGSGPGFDDPLVSFLGGGAWHPPGSEGADELSCYAMHGDKVKEYYLKGMMLNHRLLLAERPAYARELKRLYVHQSSPALVGAFVREAGLDPSRVAMKVESYGNLVSPSTIRLMHEDVVAGRIDSGDEICLSVVGAGPERGVVMCRLDKREVIPL